MLNFMNLSDIHDKITRLTCMKLTRELITQATTIYHGLHKYLKFTLLSEDQIQSLRKSNVVGYY